MSDSVYDGVPFYPEKWMRELPDGRVCFIITGGHRHDKEIKNPELGIPDYEEPTQENDVPAPKLPVRRQERDEEK